MKAHTEERLADAQASVNKIMLYHFTRNPEMITATVDKLSGISKAFKGPRNSDARRAVSYVANYLSSLADALETDELDSGLVSKFKDASKASLQTAFDALQRNEGKPPTVEEGSDASREAFDAHNAGAIARFSSYRSKLPKPKGPKAKLVTLLKLPVLVVLDPFATVEQLQHAGFEVEQISVYPVLDEQYVVALNTRLLSAAELDPNTYIKGVLVGLRKKMGCKWGLMADWSIRFGSSGHFYYWVAPERTIDALHNARSQGGSSVMDWGFPF